MSKENKLHAAHYTFPHLLSSNDYGRKKKMFSLFVWNIFFSEEKSKGVGTLKKVKKVAYCAGEKCLLRKLFEQCNFM